MQRDGRAKGDTTMCRAPIRKEHIRVHGEDSYFFGAMYIREKGNISLTRQLAVCISALGGYI